MKQYNTIKVKYPDALLLFRVGDFYETFGEDAIRAAGILNITLTARNNGGEHVELAGFPHHSLNTYLPKLVMAGCRVAICDKKGDLLFFGKSNSSIHHVGVVISEMNEPLTMIHSSTSSGIMITTIDNSDYWKRVLQYAGRVIND